MFAGKKVWVRITQGIFLLGFLLLFINRIKGYPVSFIKFSDIDFIYNNGLGFLYYVSGAIELCLATLIFFLHKRYAKIIYDVLLFSYSAFIIAYYLVLRQESGGSCIDCNYTTHFLGENLKGTAIVFFVLTLVYIFFLRAVQKK